ncbi:TetR family transcriptional regulator [Paraconexibacter sp.]|uniref:TetR family transcriptional regulator n=1 Tax=Paraconexibacter sp. TaxID=2949640 RepID=UPI00356A3762
MGLRERKKEKTARAIEEAAVRLFAERGYDATTIADIAEAAEIAPRTFFSYFPSKESVLFSDFDAKFRSLADRLAARGDADVLDAVRAWITEMLDAEGVPDQLMIARHQVIDDNEELLAFERQLTTRFEGVIAEAVAVETGLEPQDLHPRLIAAATAAGLGVLRPAPGTPEPAGLAEALEPLDDVLAFLRAGVLALDRRRQDPSRT